jgi:hypothetical protein
MTTNYECGRSEVLISTGKGGICTPRTANLGIDNKNKRVVQQQQQQLSPAKLLTVARSSQYCN